MDPARSTVLSDRSCVVFLGTLEAHFFHEFSEFYEEVIANDGGVRIDQIIAQLLHKR